METTEIWNLIRINNGGTSVRQDESKKGGKRFKFTIVNDGRMPKTILFLDALCLSFVKLSLNAHEKFFC